MGMIEVDRLVLSAYEIAMAKEVRTVNRRVFGFRGWNDGSDDDDDDVGGIVSFLVTVIAFELKDEGGSDVEVRTLATTLMGATMKESTFPGAKEPYKRKRTMIEFFFLLVLMIHLSFTQLDTQVHQPVCCHMPSFLYLCVSVYVRVCLRQSHSVRFILNLLDLW